jgi:hypothetical protein
MTAKERREHNRKLYLNQEQNEQNLHWVWDIND